MIMKPVKTGCLTSRAMLDRARIDWHLRTGHSGQEALKQTQKLVHGRDCLGNNVANANEACLMYSHEERKEGIGMFNIK